MYFAAALAMHREIQIKLTIIETKLNAFCLYPEGKYSSPRQSRLIAASFRHFAIVRNGSSAALQDTSSSRAAIGCEAATRQPDFGNHRMNVCFSRKRSFNLLEN
jgi:hypothetical protein